MRVTSPSSQAEAGVKPQPGTVQSTERHPPPRPQGGFVHLSWDGLSLSSLRLHRFDKLQRPRLDKMNPPVSTPHTLCFKSNFCVEESKVSYKYCKPYAEPTSAHQHLPYFPHLSPDFHLQLSAIAPVLHRDHLKDLSCSSYRSCNTSKAPASGVR